MGLVDEAVAKRDEAEEVALNWSCRDGSHGTCATLGYGIGGDTLATFGWLFVYLCPLSGYRGGISIDLERLLIQWAVVGFAIGGGMVYFKNSDTK